MKRLIAWAAWLAALPAMAQTEHQAHGVNDTSGMQAMDGMDMPAPPSSAPGVTHDAPVATQGDDPNQRPPNHHVPPRAPATQPSTAGMGEMDMHGSPFNVLTRVEEFERGAGPGGAATSWNAGGWLGGDINRLWWRSEGEHDRGTRDASAEAFYGRAVSAFWDLQAGIRHDFGQGRNRDWLALGVQGLAPYWFDLEATFYVGPGGRMAARVEARYDLLLTQRWILTPKLEANAYSRDDRSRGVGAGLDDIEAGLRLRYEFARRFAPYVGVTWQRRIGNGASAARASGEDAARLRWVAGLRFWF